MLGLFFAIWWQIFKKAGYSGALGLLMIVPIVNFILLLYLAFSDWPIQRDLEAWPGVQMRRHNWRLQRAPGGFARRRR
jgi:hypothetical protein